MKLKVIFLLMLIGLLFSPDTYAQQLICWDFQGRALPCPVSQPAPPIYPQSWQGNSFVTTYPQTSQPTWSQPEVRIAPTWTEPSSYYPSGGYYGGGWSQPNEQYSGYENSSTTTSRTFQYGYDPYSGPWFSGSYSRTTQTSEGTSYGVSGQVYVQPNIYHRHRRGW